MPFSSHLNHAHRHRRRALARLRPINLGVAALAGVATIGVAGALAATHPADGGASDPVADVGAPQDAGSAPAPVVAAVPDPATTPRAATSPSKGTSSSSRSQSSHKARPSTKPAAKPSVRTSTPRPATVSGGTKKPVAKSAGS